MGPSKPDPTDKPGNPDQTASPDTTARAADSNRHPAKAPKIYRDGDYLVVATDPSPVDGNSISWESLLRESALAHNQLLAALKEA